MIPKALQNHMYDVGRLAIAFFRREPAHHPLCCSLFLTVFTLGLHDLAVLATLHIQSGRNYIPKCRRVAGDFLDF